ncbi:hypothetical protein QJS66_16365 [Kocuria rhizophila]|nr:hypothetical protein QJS66_16365 [Kocuria rhizophila]
MLISYLVACTLLVLVMRALGDMAAADPSSWAFSTYAGKAPGPRWAVRSAGCGGRRSWWSWPRLPPPRSWSPRRGPPCRSGRGR